DVCAVADRSPGGDAAGGVSARLVRDCGFGRADRGRVSGDTPAGGRRGVIGLAMLAAAGACALEARRAWGRDRAINGRNRRSGFDRLRSLAALGRRTGRLVVWLPEPPIERERLCERAGSPPDIAAGTLREARAGSTLLLA